MKQQSVIIVKVDDLTGSETAAKVLQKLRDNDRQSVIGLCTSVQAMLSESPKLSLRQFLAFLEKHLFSVEIYDFGEKPKALLAKKATHSIGPRSMEPIKKDGIETKTSQSGS